MPKGMSVFQLDVPTSISIPNIETEEETTRGAKKYPSPEGTLRPHT